MYYGLVFLLTAIVWALATIWIVLLPAPVIGVTEGVPAYGYHVVLKL